MTEAIEKNLLRGIKLLNSISDVTYANNSIAPYYSSIGSHMRHVLDVFSCVLNGFEEKNVDLTLRERNVLAEQKTATGIVYFEEIIKQIRSISENDLNCKITVSDDLGLGKISVNSTLAAVLLQAQSHAIHHYASVGYIIYQLGVELPDSDFGFNPTTPKK